MTPLASGRPSSGMNAESEATFSANTLDLLGGVAEKVLALGRGEEAEKVLATTLTNLLADVRMRGGNAQPQVLEKAVHYALKLAEVTGKGRWVDYAFELYSALKRPLPAAQKSSPSSPTPPLLSHHKRRAKPRPARTSRHRRPNSTLPLPRPRTASTG